MGRESEIKNGKTKINKNKYSDIYMDTEIINTENHEKSKIDNRVARI